METLVEFMMCSALGSFLSFAPFIALRWYELRPVFQGLNGSEELSEEVLVE